MGIYVFTNLHHDRAKFVFVYFPNSINPATIGTATIGRLFRRYVQTGFHVCVYLVLLFSLAFEKFPWDFYPHVKSGLGELGTLTN